MSPNPARQTARVFFALPIAASPELEAVLSELSHGWRDLRVTPAVNLHLTLRFLGAVESDRLGGLGKVLATAAAGVGPMTLTLRGLGAFPSLSRPGVIWAGVQGADAAHGLVQRLNELLLADFGPPDHAAWQPHLTLARVKVKGRPDRQREAWLRHRAELDLGRQVIDRVELMRSELGAGGSRYTPLATVKLGR
jgi:2'-5' RNA ligase